MGKIHNTTNFFGSDSKFLVRKAELLLVEQELRKGLAGQTRVVFISGESGIGKTRLLKEVVSVTGQAKAVVLAGGCTQTEGMPPYLPFLEALGLFIKNSRAENLPKEIKPVLPVLATVFPQVIETWGEQTASYPFLPEQAR